MTLPGCAGKEVQGRQTLKNAMSFPHRGVQSWGRTTTVQKYSGGSFVSTTVARQSKHTMSFACLRVQFFENTMSFPCRGVLRSQTPSAYASKQTAAQLRVWCEICAKLTCSQTLSLPPKMGAKRTIDLYLTHDQEPLHPRPKFLEIRVKSLIIRHLLV